MNPVLLQGRSRPDLVGSDYSGAWHAFECKGRSSVPGADDRRKAKQQALRLVRVNSTNCSLHIGAITYFRQNRLEFYWRDPDPEDAERLEPIEVKLPIDAWRHYYAPTLALYNLAKTEAVSNPRTALDIHIEIHPAVLDPLLRGHWTAACSHALELRLSLPEEGFRPDGLKVVAGPSWAPLHGQQPFDL